MNTVFISVGCACIVKEVLNELKLTIPERLPFDWCGSDSNFISESLITDFKYWESPDMFYTHSIHIENNNLHIKNKTGNSGFIHDVHHRVLGDSFDPSNYYDMNGYVGDIPTPKDVMDNFIEAYQRRIKRFRDLVNTTENLVFVWHNYRYTLIYDMNTMWNALNAFTSRPFTLICLEYTDKVYDKIPYNSLAVIYATERSKCLVGTYYNGPYNLANAKMILKGILLNYAKTNIDSRLRKTVPSYI